MSAMERSNQGNKHQAESHPQATIDLNNKNVLDNIQESRILHNTTNKQESELHDNGSAIKSGREITPNKGKVGANQGSNVADTSDLIYQNNVKEMMDAMRTVENSKDENFADHVMKVNKTSTGSNPRVVHIHKGYFFYYSVVPRNWEENKFDLLVNPPKFGVKLTDIQENTKVIVQGTKAMINIRFSASKVIEFLKPTVKSKGNPILDPRNEAALGLIRMKPLKKVKGDMTWIFNSRPVQRSRSRTPNRSNINNEKSPNKLPQQGSALSIKEETDAVQQVLKKMENVIKAEHEKKRKKALEDEVVDKQKLIEQYKSEARKSISVRRSINGTDSISENLNKHSQEGEKKSEVRSAAGSEKKDMHRHESNNEFKSAIHTTPSPGTKERNENLRTEPWRPQNEEKRFFTVEDKNENLSNFENVSDHVHSEYGGGGKKYNPESDNIPNYLKMKNKFSPETKGNNSQAGSHKKLDYLDELKSTVNRKNQTHPESPKFTHKSELDSPLKFLNKDSSIISGERGKQEMSQIKNKQTVDSSENEEIKDWDKMLYSFIDECVSVPKNLEDSFRVYYKLFKAVALFREKAIGVVTEIIDELYYPLQLRKFKPLTVEETKRLRIPGAGTNFFQEFCYEDRRNSFFIRISYTDYRPVQNKQTNPENKLISSKFVPQKLLVYQQERFTAFSHEFSMNDEILDAFIEEKKKNFSFNLKVPFASVIDYMGFRAIVSSHHSYSESTMGIGFIGEEHKYITKPEISSKLDILVNHFNLKPHKIFWESKYVPIQVKLCLPVEVHEINPPSSVEKSKFSAESNLYVLNTKEIMPVDIEPSEEGDDSFMGKRFRPEFVKSYSKPLNPESFISASQTSEAVKDGEDLVEACQALRTVKIVDLLKNLENFETVPLHSLSITKLFHKYGVNMRYLGLVATQSNIQCIQEICQVEMIARASKKILRHYLTDFILNFETNSSGNLLSKKQELNPTTLTSDKTYTKLITRERVKEELIDIVIDFLNLIFGVGSETDTFWQDILKVQILHDYHYQINNKMNFPKGALLLAVLYHCDLDVNFTKDIKLGQVSDPFSRYNFLGFKTRFKTYGMRSLDINEIGNLDKGFGEKSQSAFGHNAEIVLKAKIFLLKIQQCISNIDRVCSLQSELAEAYLSLGDYPESIIRANNAMDYVHNLHSENLRAYSILIRTSLLEKKVKIAMDYFNRAIEILEFNWGPFHPLHSTFYSMFGYYYYEMNQFNDALLLYKSSLVSCLRSIGPNHPQTREVYLDMGSLYMKMGQREESLEYYLKAYKATEMIDGKESVSCAFIGDEVASLYLVDGRINESVAYSMKSLDVYKQKEQFYYLKLIDRYLDLALAGEILNNGTMCFQNSDAAWSLLVRYQVRDQQNVNKLLQLQLSMLFRRLASDQKNYIIQIVFQEVESFLRNCQLLLIEKDLDENFNKFILVLIKRSQSFKCLSDYLGNFIRKLLEFKYRNPEISVTPKFWRTYVENIEVSDEYQLEEAIITVELLLQIVGGSFFREKIDFL